MLDLLLDLPYWLMPFSREYALIAFAILWAVFGGEEGRRQLRELAAPAFLPSRLRPRLSRG